ncbi:PREDICTED: uncharacterized protein LOC104754355 [Camelina sativa]|uniref:Uncharacterized protein LOC104754355 n=1 Tax=Camelina sativa TaxID=90675 RepID=A0ABM0WQR7_CAMSA|nr:PREDICTED: uncharacterized protein LOC104754355 [Camelina sativa]
MGSIVKAYYYCQHKSSSSFQLHHHYYSRGRTTTTSNLQNPVSLFAFTSPSISSSSSSDPPSPSPSPSSSSASPRPIKHQFVGGGHFIIPSIAVAASACFFLRLHLNPPIITSSPLDDFQLQLEEPGSIRELPLLHRNHHYLLKALHFYKVKPGTVLKLLDVYDSDSYDSLKARIRLSAEWLETARRELDEVAERDPARVMEYSQVVDELMEILRDMDLYIDKCQKDNVKGYLRSCNRLLARVRRMEAQILNLLKEFHEEDDQGPGGQT